jgi:Tol biopolymer transport system component
VTTKAKRTLPITCTSPSYSPDGTSIACASPVDVFVMRTDGSGRRVVATFGEFGGQDGYSGTDWSPDGKWLLVTLPSYPELVEVATGTEIPLQALSNRAFQTLFVR